MEKNIDSRRRRRRQLNWLRLRANPNPIYAGHNCPRRRRRKRRRSRGRTQLVGRSVSRRSHPSKRAKKIRQILAGRDMGHEEEIEGRTDGRTDGRTNRWPHFSLSGLFPNRRCQFSSWYLTLSDAFLVHRAVSPPLPLPAAAAVNKV